MRSNIIGSFMWLSMFLLLSSCNAQSEKKSDFFATYKIGKTVPADSSAATLGKIRQTADWTLSLEKDDNFELKGSGKRVVGYWDIQKIADKDYKIFLQGGGWAIYGRFDGTTIYFDKAYKMFDELFSEISFTRIKK